VRWDRFRLFVAGQFTLRKVAIVLLLMGLVASMVLRSMKERIEESYVDPLPDEFSRLLPLHTKLGKPQPGDWLKGAFELGQTFREYARGSPVIPDETRRTIYVQPLGDVSAKQNRIIDRTAEFLGISFGLPVKICPALSAELVPEGARRKHSDEQTEQFLTTYIMQDILRPRLPDDACIYFAFTASDLWPGEGWNYLFGQGTIKERVGVCSLNRLGQPDESAEAFHLCLLRTLKIASHEAGHVFSMQHCTLFECNMCGSNNRDELDRRPLELCPQCLAKLCYATGADPEKRFEKLIAFCRVNGLKPQQKFYEKSLAAIRGK